MSHFSVLVIGPDVDAQLAPFHEFECTGEDDEYVQDVDVTEESLDYAKRRGERDGYTAESDPAKFLDKALCYHGLEDKIVASEDEVDREGDHKFGYAVVVDGKLVKAINRTNPNRKWDWYVEGGRWSGFFTLKNGQHCDYASKGEIDFEGMRNAAAKNAAEKWDKAFAAHGGAAWENWETVRAKHPDSIDDARTEYWHQPAVAAISTAFGGQFGTDPDEYLIPRDEYITAARNRAISPFALVKDSQWQEKGEMGWWGMSTDNMTQAEWDAKVTEILDSLPDHTTLTIVDCHI